MKEKKLSMYESDFGQLSKFEKVSLITLGIGMLIAFFVASYITGNKIFSASFLLSFGSIIVLYLFFVFLLIKNQMKFTFMSVLSLVYFVNILCRIFFDANNLLIYRCIFLISGLPLAISLIFTKWKLFRIAIRIKNFILK